MGGDAVPAPDGADKVTGWRVCGRAAQDAALPGCPASAACPLRSVVGRRRAFVYGLGAMGEAGVTTMLELVRRELDLTMVLCGVRSVAEIDRRVLHQPNR
ncbi:MAG TPA: alpha-hydroxy-acid oxidizing protein [Rhodanobacteraceae bacterium]